MSMFEDQELRAAEAGSAGIRFDSDDLVGQEEIGEALLKPSASGSRGKKNNGSQSPMMGGMPGGSGGAGGATGGAAAPTPMSGNALGLNASRLPGASPLGGTSGAVNSANMSAGASGLTAGGSAMAPGGLGAGSLGTGGLGAGGIAAGAGAGAAATGVGGLGAGAGGLGSGMNLSSGAGAIGAGAGGLIAAGSTPKAPDWQLGDPILPGDPRHPGGPSPIYPGDPGYWDIVRPAPGLQPPGGGVGTPGGPGASYPPGYTPPGHGVPGAPPRSPGDGAVPTNPGGPGAAGATQPAPTAPGDASASGPGGTSGSGGVSAGAGTGSSYSGGSGAGGYGRSGATPRGGRHDGFTVNYDAVEAWARRWKVISDQLGAAGAGMGPHESSLLLRPAAPGTRFLQDHLSNRTKQTSDRMEDTGVRLDQDGMEYYQREAENAASSVKFISKQEG